MHDKDEQQHDSQRDVVQQPDPSEQLRPSDADGLVTAYGIHMPPSCPPGNAGSVDFSLYRLVLPGNLTESSFRTSQEDGRFPEGDPCIRCSISTYGDRRSAEKLRERATYFLNHVLAAGVITPEAGVTCRTPSRWSRHHYSWWPRVGVIRSSFFRIVA